MPRVNAAALVMRTYLISLFYWSRDMMSAMLGHDRDNLYHLSFPVTFIYITLYLCVFLSGWICGPVSSGIDHGESELEIHFKR